METLMKAKDRVFELQRKSDALNARRRELDLKISRETEKQAALTRERESRVADLAGADEATSGWAHAEIDRLDSELRQSSRVSESLAKPLSALLGEISSNAAELSEASQALARENFAREFGEFRKAIEGKFSDAVELFGKVRQILADLNESAFDASEKFGVPAQEFVAPMFEDFCHHQANPGLDGWRDSRKHFHNLNLRVYPMRKVA